MARASSVGYRRRRALLVGGIVGCLFIGCERESKPTVTGAAKDYNVLLITMDTTRADRLSCYGYPIETTPHLDRLAAEGARFAQCTSPAPITLPAHCSLMTGTSPYVHGVRANGALPVPEANVTLAELLKQGGYATAARVAAFVLDARWGLNQGFDDYQGVEVREPTALEPDEGGAIAGLARQQVFAERPGEEVREEAVTWLKANGGKKFFMWVHFFDPHMGYEPPEPYATAFRHGYDGEIAYVDAQIGALMDALDALKIRERTLMVVTADHGEGLGDHGEMTHLNFLYDTTLHVPLILWCPGKIAAGRVVEGQVRLIDVAPTILDLVGRPVNADAQGVSLGPLLAGEREGPDPPAYSETFMPRYLLDCAHGRSLRADGWKYIHLPEPELYHVREDPKELVNLIEKEPDRAEAMRERLHDLLAEAPPAALTTRPAMETTSEEAERLEAIGYIDVSENAVREAGVPEMKLFEPEGDDPKHHVEDFGLLAKGVGGVHTQDYALAEPFFATLVQRGAGTPAITRWYVEALTAQGKIEAAIAELKRAVGLHPDYAEAYNDLGLLQHRMGQNEEAAKSYARAAELKPHLEYFRINLGNTYLDLDRLDEAEAIFQKLVGDNPKRSDALSGLGTVAAKRGAYDQAIERYRGAIALEPQRAEYHFNLGHALSQAGRLPEAEGTFRETLRIRPTYVDAWWILGATLVRQERWDEATSAYAKMIELDPKRAYVPIEFGSVLATRGRHAKAVELLRGVLQRVPDSKIAANNLAWLLATAPDDGIRDAAEAVRLAEALCPPGEPCPPGALDTLAAAYAEAGRFDDAVRTMKQAISGVSQSAPEGDPADALRRRLELYEKHTPYHEAPSTRPTEP